MKQTCRDFVLCNIIIFITLKQKMMRVFTMCQFGFIQSYTLALPTGESMWLKEVSVIINCIRPTYTDLAMDDIIIIVFAHL